MPNNVIIKRGAQDWKIFQQTDGNAVIEISGTRIKTDNPNDSAWARIVSEDTQSVVCDWQRAEELEVENEVTFNIRITTPAGGLYRLETCLASSLNGIEWSPGGDMIHHLGVGDLYVIAGQSNAAGYGRTPVYDPPELGVHLYKNSENWDLACHPMNDSTMSVHEINAEGVNSGHSPYLSFAKRMKRDLNYPIGLIQTSLGGSPMSRWLPELNGDLYKNMKDVIGRCTDSRNQIAGVLWYQGCSDANENDCEKYLDRFGAMVGHLRRDFSNETLPIYTVQLNKVLGQSTDLQDRCWAVLREAQRQAARTIPHVYVIPTVDLGLNDGIHNSSASNMIIGERLANAALEGRFGRNVYGKAPDIESAVFVDNKAEEKQSVMLTFSNVYHYIAALGESAEKLQFSVCDDAGCIEVTGYSQNDNTLTLELEHKPDSDATVSYAAVSAPVSNVPLDMGSGLPILCFYGFPIQFQ